MTIAASSLQSQIQSAALQFGFDHAALVPLCISERDVRTYDEWCDAGLASGMAYMTENKHARKNPASAYGGARSALTLGVSYYQGALPPKPGRAFGRVARYAWGLDYHTIITERLRAFLPEMKKILGDEIDATLAVDTKPLLERALAASSGAGFIGKNTIFIATGRPRFHVGSWIFLCEILLSVEAPVADVSKELAGCGGCTKCLTACPTDAFEKPYRLNAGRCLAYLTIENKGPIPLKMRASAGDWLFGCDVCQEVCPFNARAFETRWPEFKPERGAGAWIDVRDVLALRTTAEFKAKYGPTPLARAKRKGLIRNACVVAGNSDDESLAPILETLTDDAEPLVRGHALWALSRVNPSRAKARAEALRVDADEFVRAEAQAILC